MSPWLSVLVVAGALVVSALAGRYVVQVVLWLASRSADAGRGGRRTGTDLPDGTAPPDGTASLDDTAPPDDARSPGDPPPAPTTSAGATAAERAPSADDAPPPDQAGALRGGTWIGVLERVAVTGALLAGYPAAVAFVIAVKGLGRYPELREHPGSSERFVIGTLASLVWAAGCGVAGAALLGTRVLGV